jgi:mxaD protein
MLSPRHDGVRQPPGRIAMARVHITREFDKPADELWALIGDFHGVHKWVPGVEPSESIEGGKARKLQMGPNAIIERLVDKGERSYTYSMDDDGPLPVTGYRSTLAVKDVGGGKSAVDWEGSFEPVAGSTEESAVQIMTMVYEGGLSGLEKTLSS